MNAITHTNVAPAYAPLLQQSKPGQQQDNCRSRLGDAKNDSKVLRVTGSGESGNHLVIAGQIGKR